MEQRGRQEQAHLQLKDFVLCRIRRSSGKQQQSGRHTDYQSQRHSMPQTPGNYGHGTVGQQDTEHSEPGYKGASYQQRQTQEMHGAEETRVAGRFRNSNRNAGGLQPFPKRCECWHCRIIKDAEAFRARNVIAMINSGV
jgi:hypothetical protein